MVDQTALVAAFDDYARILLRPFEIGEVLYLLTDQAVDVLGVVGAGVSLAKDGQGLQFVAATDAHITTIEAQQARTGEGPCHTAYTTGELVAVSDLTQEQRWESYRTVALAHECRAVAGVPMPLGELRIGALNLYHMNTHEWTSEELDVAQMLANMATGYVLNQTELRESRTRTEQLRQALDSRIIIEQAKGVLSGRLDTTPDDAFDLMRHHARRTNTKLHDLAREVIAGAADLSAISQ